MYSKIIILLANNQIELASNYSIALLKSRLHPPKLADNKGNNVGEIYAVRSFR